MAGRVCVGGCWESTACPSSPQADVLVPQRNHRAFVLLLLCISLGYVTLFAIAILRAMDLHRDNGFKHLWYHWDW